MKTREELNALKVEVETMNKKLAELTEKELELVSGGRKSIGMPADTSIACPVCGGKLMGTYDWETQLFKNIYCCSLYDFGYGGSITSAECHRMAVSGWNLEKYPNQL